MITVHYYGVILLLMMITKYKTRPCMIFILVFKLIVLCIYIFTFLQIIMYKNCTKSIFYLCTEVSVMLNLFQIGHCRETSYQLMKIWSSVSKYSTRILKWWDVFLPHKLKTRYIMQIWDIHWTLNIWSIHFHAKRLYGHVWYSRYSL